MLKICLILGAVIACIVVLASVIPVCQFLYHQFIQNKTKLQTRYYFSETLFNRHMSHDIGLNDVRAINNRKELSKLWDVELTHDLP